MTSLNSNDIRMLGLLKKFLKLKKKQGWGRKQSIVSFSSNDIFNIELIKNKYLSFAFKNGKQQTFAYYDLNLREVEEVIKFLVWKMNL